MDANAQIYFDQRAAARACLRRMPGIDQYDPTTGPFCLVHRGADQLTPGGIGDTLGQAVVFEHSIRVHVLKGDDAVFVDPSARQFVGEIGPTVGDTLVYLGDNLAPLRSLWRPLLNLAQLALGLRQRLLIPAKEAWIRNLLAGRERGETLKPNVNANRLWTGCHRFRLDLAGEAGVPVACHCAADRARLDPALDRPMQNDLHIAYLGEREAVAVQPEAKLRVGERIVPAFPAKTRITELLSGFDTAKESLKCKVYPLLGILQNLGVGDGQKWVFLLPVREQLVCRVQAEAFLPLLPRFLANLQCLVIDPTRCVKRLLQQTLVTLGRGEAVSEALSYIIRDLRKTARSELKLLKRMKPLYPTAEAGGLYGLDL